MKMILMQMDNVNTKFGRQKWLLDEFSYKRFFADCWRKLWHRDQQTKKMNAMLPFTLLQLLMD